jgi:hypothetical protein
VSDDFGRSVSELVALFELGPEARAELTKSVLARMDETWIGRRETIEREALCYMQGWIDCREQLVALLGERLLGALYQAKSSPNVMSEDVRGDDS